MKMKWWMIIGFEGFMYEVLAWKRIGGVRSRYLRVTVLYEGQGRVDAEGVFGG
jgi:hypothetical protein